VKLDASVGAQLVLEGWDEINGAKDVFLTVDLFNSPTIFSFPELCFSFGSASPGTCSDVPDDDNEAQYEDNEVVSGEKRKRSGGCLIPRDDFTKRGELVPRAPNRRRNPYHLTCDKTSEALIYVQQYPGPTKVKNDPNRAAPIMEPGIACTATACPPSDWTMKESSDATIVSHTTWGSKFLFFYRA
jgi:hypothetical protein